MNPRGLRLLFAVTLLAGCGGGGRSLSSDSGISATGSGVEIDGKAVQRGTRGPVLVFAYTDLAPNEDPATHEAATIGIVGPDGAFDLVIPGGGTTTLVFLADGANDGVIDPRDSTARLSSPELADLQPGDRVQISDATLDFTHHQVMATVEVIRAGEPPRTPTPLP
jgi:hypothetical protein